MAVEERARGLEVLCRCADETRHDAVSDDVQALVARSRCTTFCGRVWRLDGEPGLAFGLSGKCSVVREYRARRITCLQRGAGHVLSGRNPVRTKGMSQPVMPPRQKASSLGSGVLCGRDTSRTLAPCLAGWPDGTPLPGQRRSPLGLSSCSAHTTLTFLAERPECERTQCL